MSLEDSQRSFIRQLSAMIRQVELQADATFDAKSWAEVSWPQFAGRWEPLIKTQIELLARLKSGALPQWALDQQAAYEASAIGRLMKAKEGTSNE